MVFLVWRFGVLKRLEDKRIEGMEWCGVIKERTEMKRRTKKEESMSTGRYI